MRSLTFVAALMLLGVPAGALADEPGENVTQYSFVDELVQGDLTNPNGEVLTVRPRGERQSLVRARPHFIPELLKSVERL